MSLSDKVIIEVGLNEGQRREANPHTAYSPSEIADDAKACYEAGAAVVHYHGRDPVTGAALSNDPRVNVEAQRLITQSTPLIAYPTYASHVRVLDWYDIGGPAAERYAHIVAGVKAGVKYELAPVDLGIVDRNAMRDPRSGKWSLSRGGLLNTGEDHEWLLDFCRKHSLKPTFAAFDVSHLRNLRNLVDMGMAGGQPLVLKLFLTEHEFASKTLLFSIERLRDLGLGSTSWMPLAYGCDQFPLAASSLAMGGHVRVGIGDYAYRELGCPTNASLVQRAVSMARAIGREPATPDEARRIMRIGQAWE
ncbi:MAG: 3-keto-5-aminohexanoate cleavage protein [Chloroflexi bacterium]|nr:3-keto-5-aminohexanoate cleavage protein [Chloroflexota bacterium]